MTRPVILGVLTVLIGACTNGDTDGRPGISIIGVVIQVDVNEELQIPSVRYVSDLPAHNGLSVIPGATVVLSNSSGDRDVAQTGGNGRFSVRLRGLEGQATDSLTVDHLAFKGVILTHLGVGAGSKLKAGENAIVIELPAAPPCSPGAEDCKERVGVTKNTAAP